MLPHPLPPHTSPVFHIPNSSAHNVEVSTEEDWNGNGSEHEPESIYVNVKKGAKGRNVDVSKGEVVVYDVPVSFEKADGVVSHSRIQPLGVDLNSKRKSDLVGDLVK